MNPANVPIVITTPDGLMDSEVDMWLAMQPNPVVHLAQPPRLACKDPAKNRCVNIATGRTAAMFIALKQYPLADYFFFLDNDVRPPLGAIKALIAHHRPAVGGWFEARFGGWVGGRDGADGFRLFEEPLPGLITTHLLSLGCTAIHRDYLGEPFDPGIDSYVKMEGGRVCHLADSGAFSRRMLNWGVELFLDGDVIASHQSKGVAYV